jgi:hypothetical protein
MLTIKNISANTVNAFVYTFPLRGAPASLNMAVQEFRDPLLEGESKPIPPNQELTVNLAGASLADIQLRAVLFADGSIWGDPDWAQRISTRRRTMVQQLVPVLADLNSALARGTSREDLVSQFESSLKLETQIAGHGDPGADVINPRRVVLVNLRLNARNPVDVVVRSQIQHLTSQMEALQAATQ